MEAVWNTKETDDKSDDLSSGSAHLLSTIRSWLLWTWASCFKIQDMFLPYKAVATIEMENVYLSITKS